MYSYYSRHAHGDSMTQYFIIDTAQKRILDVGELINPVPQTEIKGILESKYSIDNYLRENIWPPDTVNFRAGSVELIWNVYTIAPYVYGAINVEIPYSDIERYLTDKGKKLKKTVQEPAGGSAGTTAVFGLRGNPTTGFNWEVSMDGEGLFDLERRSFGSYSPNVAGAPITEELILKAVEAGVVKISFVYERPWEGGERLVEYIFTFKIHDNLRVELLGTEKTVSPGVDEETLPAMPELKAR